MDFADGKAGPRFAPVILAGGSGTRFWPRSRRARAKQVLALDGERTMIQQTLDRLLPLAAADDVWVITNTLLDAAIAEQLPQVPRGNILSEPVARNTAPACALAAFLLEPDSAGDGDRDISVGPCGEGRGAIRRGDSRGRGAGGERRADCGAGRAADARGDRIRLHRAGRDGGPSACPASGVPVRRVKRFTEKPDRARAEEFVASGNYAWNGGIFLWSATHAGECDSRALPGDGAAAGEDCAAALSEDGLEFERVFAEAYPQCENIAIDYAVLEPRSAKGESADRRFIACRRIWRGTISGRGRRWMSIARAARRAGAASERVRRRERDAGGDRCQRELCVCAGQGGGAAWRERPGGGGDGGRAADYDAGAVAGRGQGGCGVEGAGTGRPGLMQ